MESNLAMRLMDDELGFDLDVVEVMGMNFSLSLASALASLNLDVSDGSLLLIASTRYLTIEC